MGGNWNTEMGYGVPSAAHCLKNLARYNRGIGGDEGDGDGPERKPPVYEGPAFEIEPVDSTSASEADTSKMAPLSR